MKTIASKTVTNCNNQKAETKNIQKMKMKTSNEMTFANGISLQSTLVLAAALALACVPAGAKQHHDNDETHYRAINLVSDIAGVGQVQDTNLVNGWGISYHDTFPFWVSDNGTGVTTLYAVTNDASGAPHASIVPASAIGNGGGGAAIVSIPGLGNVTGQVANNTAGFNGDIFLFVSEDGTVSGWSGGTSAVLKVNNAGSAIYKGVTIAQNNGAPTSSTPLIFSRAPWTFLTKTPFSHSKPRCLFRSPSY